MQTRNPLLVPEIREFIAEGNAAPLHELCASVHPAAVAELIAALEPPEIWQVLRHAPAAARVEIFSHLEPELQVETAAAIPLDDLACLVDDMPADDRVDLLKLLPEDLREAVLPRLSQAERDDIRKLSAYEEKTAGAIMTSDHATLREEWTAAQAIDALRREAPNKETIYYAYVVDAAGKLLGFVSLRNLILANPDALIRDIMKTNVLFVRTDEDQEEALHMMQKYDLIALPVVNGDNRLVGIITVDDIMDVGEEEATTDFHRMATVGAVATGMKEAGLWTLYRARTPWLMILVFVNIFSGAGIAYFEHTIETVVALVFFLPLLIDSAGNAGAQAATLIVRAMATGDVAMRDWFRIVMRDVVTCLLIGLTMALAVSSIAAVRAPDVMVPVALSMWCIVMFGSLVGTVLPFLLTRLRLDPAAASGPLVTSLADIGGVIIYFSIATWYLGLGTV